MRPEAARQHTRIRHYEAKLFPVVQAAELKVFNKVLHGNHIPGLRRAGLVAALSDGDLDLTGLWADEVTATLAPAILSIFRAAARDMMAKYPAISRALGSTFLDNIRNVRADAYLASVDNRLVGIGDSAFNDARAALQTALDQGLSVPKTADAVQAALQVSLNRATTIARTEAAAAVNGADWATFSEMQAQDDTLTVTQEWLATTDARTRQDHLDADGQVVPVDSPFSVGGEDLLYPGDPDGSAEQTINCRCTTLTSLGDEGQTGE